MAVVTRISVRDIEEISKAVKARQEKFGEDLKQSIGVVLLNYGDRYTNIRCVKGEWHGQKKDLVSSDNTPRCPNGHRLVEISQSPILAIIDGEMNG